MESYSSVKKKHGLFSVYIDMEDIWDILLSEKYKFQFGRNSVGTPTKWLFMQMGACAQAGGKMDLV